MRSLILALYFWSTLMSLTAVSAEEIGIAISNSGKPISPDLFGIFFEDLNYAADGGLYGELVQNRSFDYQATEQLSWNSISFWELIQRGGGRGHLAIDSGLPVHRNNPNHVVLNCAEVGEGVGLMNPGFDGIAIKKGEAYVFSLFARQLYMNARWGAGSSIEGKPMPMTVRLESKEGKNLGELKFQIVGRVWKRMEGEIIASETEENARLVILAGERGGVAMDEISLFPKKTFRNRKNGLRADLAQTIADLKPRFIRFPGGCLAHGNGIGNIYRWKDTIGLIEQRKGQANLWGYHQSVGLGYFEYFQFCEDIGAKPLPVVAAGVSCQNSAHQAGVGQQCIPIEEMPAYIQDILDLIEWANGPATSTWGAKRAEAGHPEPFNLKYLGVGNEDHITPGFEERFQMIFDAIRAKHPEITVIGTVGPAAGGEDFDKGWRIANAIHVPIVDEHYYVGVDWFWDNLKRYDSYDRSKSKVYLGEYAAHDRDRRSTLRSALAEAAYLTGLERNGDVVVLSSYAPLLGRQHHMQWRPDLIYFNNTTISQTINYYVQRLFGENAGDEYLPAEVTGLTGDKTNFAMSCVRETKSGDVIIKLVSRSDQPMKVMIDLSQLGDFAHEASCTTLSGDPMAENEFGKEAKVAPITRKVNGASQMEHSLPANGMVVLRLKKP
jgi:alpha-L-arabinofuranosidase